MPRPKRAVLLTACIILGTVLAVGAIWPAWFTGRERAIVVYCAHDAVFADGILKDFEKQTGIPVNVVYDSEATKSLGLVNRLKLEKDDPHCDVFWNNELLGTMDLAGDGVLEPYKGSGYARIPARFKDKEGRWTGFAARMRVWIVNTKNSPPGETHPAERFDRDVARAAIAKPLYGTTLTHFSILWQVRGASEVKHWYVEAKRRGLKVLNGNARVKDAVADGECDLGWTDTDDCFEAIDDKKPVTKVRLTVEEPQKTDRHEFTVIIPNTVALVRGSRHRRDAERLIDYLLSAETEVALAKSKSRQLPLGPVDSKQLPPEVRELMTYVPQGYDLTKLEDARRECLAWLKSESP